MKKYAFTILCMLAILSSICALDVRSGVVRVSTDDLTLRPILYRLVNISGKSKYEPLFFLDDPRTSFIVVSIDNRMYRLGISQEYQVSQKRIANGVEIAYQSAVNRITQRITLTAFGGSRVANGFIFEIAVENLSQRDSKVMIKQVLDTWLGEKSGVHFALPNAPSINEELLYERNSLPEYIVCPGDSASIALLLKEDSVPDSVLLANWKRMSDSKFFYESNLMRGFSLAPYSINDSALALFWNERIVPAGSSITVMSKWITGGPGEEFIPWMSEHYPFSSGDAEQAQPNPEPALALPPLDVQDLLELIARIDQAIGNVDTMSEEEVSALLNEVEQCEIGAGGDGALGQNKASP